MVGSVFGEFAFMPLPFNKYEMSEKEMTDKLKETFGASTAELISCFRSAYQIKNGRERNRTIRLGYDYLVRRYPNGETITVGEDEIFAMGDHRSVSCDSRDSSVGMISEKAVVGKAFVRLYPFNEIGTL